MDRPLATPPRAAIQHLCCLLNVTANAGRPDSHPKGWKCGKGCWPNSIQQVTCAGNLQACRLCRQTRAELRRFRKWTSGKERVFKAVAKLQTPSRRKEGRRNPQPSRPNHIAAIYSLSPQIERRGGGPKTESKTSHLKIINNRQC